MDRYDRQMRVRQIGTDGQKKIMQTTLLIVGVGALGSYAAELATRMGFKKLILIDRDFVEWSNLQRQTLFTEQDVQDKLPKAYAAKKHLEAINRNVHIESIVDDANLETLSGYESEVDAVLDCTDNFATRRFLNAFCHAHDLPWIYTSCAGTYASVFPIRSQDSACLTCLIGEAPQTNEASCDLIGVHAPLIPITAGFQVSLLTRLLLDENFEYNVFYQLDNWTMTFQSLKVAKQPDCPSCGSHSDLETNFSEKPVALCGRDTVQFCFPSRKRAEFTQITKRLQAEEIEFSQNPFILTFRFSAYTFSVFKNGRVLIHGTSDLTEAKKAYHHFFN
ncbi:ThiF family adenylyltransferase [Listeria valentina]|uniref:ThiF family adenylyltransferase n=1 Tax=Listeria valentina TaxID=2705293 RepID=UPI00143115EE|nr:ThiF family adenylyltransferase [Listeria valentina]